jgi:hypothetical protein
MVDNNRASKRTSAPRLESLETRNLLSVLINAKPTLEVLAQGNRVRNDHGAISIVQPTPITVTGTAQPPAANVQVVVQIFAKDANGNLVNGGAPLATAVPDFSGQYTATLSLPSRLRKDVNVLFAREVAVGTLGSTLQINPTTLAGLNGNLAINGTALRNLVATINNSAAAGVLNGSLVTPATPITGIGGSITTPLFPITTPAGPGTAGPAVSTLLGGTGTLDAQIGTIVGGAVSTPASTSNLTGGTGIIDPTTGTLVQTGTAAIAGTGGSSTLFVNEVAVSEPITVLIHQSQAIPGSTIQTQAKSRNARENGSRLHPVAPSGLQALALKAIKARPASRGRSR